MEAAIEVTDEQVSDEMRAGLTHLMNVPKETTLVHHNTSFKEQYRTVDAVLLMHRS